MKITDALLLFFVITLNGCANYKSCRLAPDSINYTISRDRQTGELTDYFGVSWQLK
jgi:predicted 3-demethylubiquinone-9 3-methyltransferase (glyoxalase superfamily)